MSDHDEGSSSRAPDRLVSFDSIEFFSTAAFVGMDPRLQRLAARRERGLLEQASASTDQDEVAVIAKVSDVEAWEQTSEVRVGATMGAPAPDGTQIVTGRIPVSRIANVRQLPFVRSLKASQILQPTLSASTLETGARPDLLPVEHVAGGGAGAVVGVIDYGGDFVHKNFRNAGGGTRIEALWHQAGPTSSSSPFEYGREYSADEINAALQVADPYAALGYGPRPDTIFSVGAHGTHVMDIAAGNGRGSGVPGMAPDATLIFVDVSHADLPFAGPDVVGASFGDSTRLLEAVKYIFDRAGDRPCAINISLGTNGGPHDGSTLVEDGIDRLVRQAPNRAVVIAASNAFDDGIHAAGQVAQGAHVDLVWEIPFQDSSHNELEIWYSGQDRFILELIAPNGQSRGQVVPGQNGSLVSGGQVVAFVANRLADPNNGDNMIGVFLEDVMPSGSWVIRLHGDTVVDGRFHAWIERDNAKPSGFAPPHDNSLTIGSISCGQESIVVGSYDAHKSSRPISFFSSAGPTRDGREKPELSGPGHGVFAAHSRTETGVTRKNGTSMASPAVTGIVALMLAEATARGLSLTIAQIRELLTDQARRTPPPAGQWHDRFGHGRVSAVGSVQAVIDLATGAGPGAPSAATGSVARTRKTTGKKVAKRRKATSRKTVAKRRKATNREKGAAR